MNDKECEFNIKNDDNKTIVNESQFINYYANSANIVFGNYDFQFLFSHQSPLIIKDGVVANNIIRMTMSPQHAKVFSIILEKNIKEYEKTFGNIEIKEEFIKSLEIGKK